MKSRSRKLAALVAVWLALGQAGSLVAARPAEADKEAFRRVSDRLLCQCGCHYGLSHCPHLECPSAPVMRKAIQEKLGAGLSEEQVVKAMVADFGPAVLGAPPAEGFNLTAWIMPFFALALGLWAAIAVLRRWRAAPATPPAAGGAAVSDQNRAAAERELRRLEE